MALRVASTIKNPVRTVSETVDDFYKALRACKLTTAANTAARNGIEAARALSNVVWGLLPEDLLRRPGRVCQGRGRQILVSYIVCV